jgi:hypothetical protein
MIMYYFLPFLRKMGKIIDADNIFMVMEFEANPTNEI